MTAQTPYALQNASHSASLFRSAVHSPWQGPGIIAPGEYAVTAQSTPNMSVQVAGGRAWMKGTQVSNVSGQTFSTQSAYFGLNDAPVTVTIATANATNPRIDLVYVAVNDSFYSGTNNNLTIGVVTGTPAASPVAPAAPSNSLTLATVAVAANATSITNSNITQTATSSLLAVTRGGIDPVTSTDSTAGLYTDQYRGHPTKGLQRWNGSAWQTVGLSGVFQWAGATTDSPLRIAAGTYSASFSAINYVDTNIGFSPAFTQPPVVVATPTDAGSNGQIVVHANSINTGGAVLITQAASSITATITGNWLAIGI